MHENLATDLNEQFEYLQGILDLIDAKKINQWTREFQTFFLKSKRLVQIAPEEAKNQKLMDVFEKYFPEKPTGNFILGRHISHTLFVYGLKLKAILFFERLH